MFPRFAFEMLALVSLQLPFLGVAQQEGARSLPEVVLQVPHAAWITAIAVSRDGRHYATSSADTTIEVWDARTALMERVLRGHQGSVTDICFSPDSRSIVSGSEDGSVRVWDIATGNPVQNLATGAPVGRVLWSPDGKQIAATANKLTLTWDTATWSKGQLPNPSLSQRPNVGAYSSDSRTLLFDGGGEIGFVDAHTGTRLPDVNFPAELRGEPNDRYVAGMFNGQLGVWDSQAMKPVKVLTVDERVLMAAAVSPDGQLVAATGDHDDVAVWSVSTGKEVFRWEGKSSLGDPRRMDAVAFSMDSKTLFTGDGSGQLQQFQIETGIELRRSHAPLDRMLRTDYTSDGTMVIASSNEAFAWGVDGAIRSFDLQRKESWLCPWAPNYAIRPGSDELTYCDVQGVSGIDLETGEITNYGADIQSASLAWSGKGEYLAAAGSYNGVTGCKHIFIYHIADTRNRRELPFSDCTQAALFTPDEKTLVIGTTTYTGPLVPVFGAPASEPPHAALRFIAVDSATVTRTVEMPDQSVVSLAQNRDGSEVAVLLSNGTALLLDDHGRELHRWLIPGGATRPDWAGHAIAFSHRGDVLAVSNGEAVSMFATSSPYREVRSVNVGSGQFPHAVSFSPEDDRLLVSNDNSASVWNLSDGTELVRVYLSGSEGYFVVTPEGYYMSYDSGDLVAFRYRDRIYPFDEFDVRYNRPDKVLQKVNPAGSEAAQDYQKAWLRRLEHLGLTEATALAPLDDAPRINADIVSSSANTVSLHITATPTHSPLKELFVSVNGSRLRIAGGVRPPGKADTPWSTELVVPLSPGDNTIHVSVRDAAGDTSLRQTLRTYSVQPHAKPRLFALLVGISKYQQNQFNLTYADHDAEMLSRFLQRQRGEYSEVTAAEVLNEKATHANILSAIKQLGAAGQDDHVIITLSGHGMLDKDGNYYFAPSDMDFAHPQQDGITYAELESALSGLASRNKLLLIDSCHAGEIDHAPVLPSKNAAPKADSRVQQIHAKGFDLEQVATFSGASRMMEALFTDLKTGTGTSVIAASAGDEVALESDKWRDGVFTYAFISGISDGMADENGDGVITVEELRRYIAGEVKQLTGGAQQPSTRSDNSWDDFVVAMPDRLLRSFALSGSQVSSTSFSPSGHKVLASSTSGLHRVWDVDSASLLSTLGTVGEGPQAAFVSEDRYRSLLGNSLIDFRLTDASETSHPFSFGTPPLPLQFPRAFDASTGLAVGHLFSGGTAEQAAVVNSMGGNSGTVVSTWDSPVDREKGLEAFAISPDGKLVVESKSEISGTTSSVELHNSFSGALLRTLTGDDIIASLRFSPDGKWLAAGCSGDHVIVWNLTDPDHPHGLGVERSEKEGNFALSFTPDGKKLAVGSSTGVVHIWDLGTFSLADTVPNNDRVGGLSFDPGGRVLAVGGYSGYVRLWDMSVGAFQ